VIYENVPANLAKRAYKLQHCTDP